MSYIEGYVSEEIFNIDGLSGAKPYSHFSSLLWKALILRRPVQKISLDKTAEMWYIYIYISPFIISYFLSVVNRDFFFYFWALIFQNLLIFFWFPCNFSYDYFFFHCSLLWLSDEMEK